MNDTVLSPAEKHYRNHLKHVIAYQKRNPEKMREKCRRRNEKFKNERPEEYAIFLEKQKAYYKEYNRLRKEKKIKNELNHI
jgi:hypothetical protein